MIRSEIVTTLGKHPGKKNSEYHDDLKNYTGKTGKSLSPLVCSKYVKLKVKQNIFNTQRANSSLNSLKFTSTKRN